MNGNDSLATIKRSYKIKGHHVTMRHEVSGGSGVVLDQKGWISYSV